MLSFNLFECKVPNFHENFENIMIKLTEIW